MAVIFYYDMMLFFFLNLLKVNFKFSFNEKKIMFIISIILQQDI